MNSCVFAFDEWRIKREEGGDGDSDGDTADGRLSKEAQQKRFVQY